MKIWLRAGIEVDITKTELDALIVSDNQESAIIELIKRGELSGETYILGKSYGGVDDYDNPDEEISVLLDGKLADLFASRKK